jgi:7,8-dihydropterin-6-yl-methyl-4-(beta-D-ribofuranosyl)aminobenzene 5'-phosphate synthase
MILRNVKFARAGTGVGRNMLAIKKPWLQILSWAAALFAVISLCSSPAVAADGKTHQVHALKITVLVTNLAGDPRLGDGEWGYSALVEVDGNKILYDTGASPDMVIKNAKALNVDLSDVEDVVLSHNHWDHVGGLMALRREFAKTNRRAMSRIHAGAGIFEPRLDDAGEDHNGLRLIKAEYLGTDGAFIIPDKPTELYPGV